MSQSELAFGFLGGTVILSMFIWIGVALYLTHTSMDEMLKHLKNSPTVVTLAFCRRSGIWGKLMLIGGISGFVTFPRRHIKNGSVSAEDIESLPTPLKRKLVILHLSALVLLISVFLLWGIGKVFGWL